MPSTLDSALALQGLERMPLSVIVLDSAQRIAWLNPAAETLLGIKSAQLLGRQTGETPPDLRECIFHPQETLYLDTTPQRGSRWLRCWRESAGEGHTFHFYSDITPLRHASDEIARLSEQLAQNTLRDTVTGLPNRRALFEGLDSLVSRSRRYENPLSVILLRVNNLARIEAEQGGDIGGRLMIALGQMLKDQVRWADTVGRLDHDEFLLILPETAEEAARALAAKLAEKARELTITNVQQQPAQAAVEIATAGWTKGDDRDKLLRRARQDMSAADN